MSPRIVGFEPAPWLARLLAFLLDPAKRKAFYGILGAAGVLLVTFGVTNDSAVTSWIGVVVAAIDFVALLLASWKARRGDWTAIYLAAAVIVGALKTAGVLTDGQASHALDILAAGVAILPLLVAFIRTDTKTPTGEPLAEFELRAVPEGDPTQPLGQWGSV